MVQFQYHHRPTGTRCRSLRSTRTCPHRLSVLLLFHALCCLPVILCHLDPPPGHGPSNVFGGGGEACSGCAGDEKRSSSTRLGAPSLAPSIRNMPLPYWNHGNTTSSSTTSNSIAPSPTPFPTSNFDFLHPTTSSSSSSSSDGSWASTGHANYLIAAFFLIAAGWLFVAFLYGVLVLVVIRLRRRGPMDIHDAYFGRVYLWGSPTSTYGCYIPMGWLLRRYVLALNERNVIASRMSRAERRAALEVLFQDTAALKDKHRMAAAMKRKTTTTATTVVADNNNNKDVIMERDESNNTNVGAALCTGQHIAPGQEDYGKIVLEKEKGRLIKDEEGMVVVDLEGAGQQATTTAQLASSSPDLDETASNAEPVCSICLGEYDPTEEPVFQSPTCAHLFHKACILDWLERRDNTECPCCRGDIIDEEDVWKTVTRQRRQRRRAEQGIRHRLQQLFRPRQQQQPASSNNNNNNNPDESMETEQSSGADDDVETELARPVRLERQPHQPVSHAPTRSSRTNAWARQTVPNNATMADETESLHSRATVSRTPRDHVVVVVPPPSHVSSRTTTAARQPPQPPIPPAPLVVVQESLALPLTEVIPQQDDNHSEQQERSDEDLFAAEQPMAGNESASAPSLSSST